MNNKFQEKMKYSFEGYFVSYIYFQIISFRAASNKTQNNLHLFVFEFWRTDDFLKWYLLNKQAPLATDCQNN